jgi:hypothetical protein
MFAFSEAVGRYERTANSTVSDRACETQHHGLQCFLVINTKELVAQWMMAQRSGTQ